MFLDNLGILVEEENAEKIMVLLFFDALVKSQKSSHSRETCPRPDRGAGVHNNLKLLDSYWSLSST
jgi:hypothetical protein